MFTNLLVVGLFLFSNTFAENDNVDVSVYPLTTLLWPLNTNVTQNSVTSYLLNSLQRVKEGVSKASDADIDILVLQEAYFWNEGYPFGRKKFSYWGEEIPEADGKKPSDLCECNTMNNFSLYKSIGCLALIFDINLLANVIENKPCDQDFDSNCPADGHYQLNTEVVWNRTGHFIAKYHKRHPYGTIPMIDPAPTVEIVTCQLEGMEFGLFICFDIQFPHPSLDLIAKGVKNFLYSTEWPLYIPFFTAAQIHFAWTRKYELNSFISSNAANLGSGIFHAQFVKNSIIKSDGLLISSKISKTSQNIPENGLEFYDFPILHPEQKTCYFPYNQTGTCVFLNPLDDVPTRLQLSSDGIFCDLQYQLKTSYPYDASNNMSYAFVLLNEYITVGGIWYVKGCALVQCETDGHCENYQFFQKGWKFNSLTMTGNVAEKDEVLPILGDDEGFPIDGKDSSFHYKNGNTTLQLTNSNLRLGSMVLYGLKI